ncbi:hypothetical protein RBB79_17010 [Tunturiibacter empetritectus]|uniref:Uncharacterized protein n=2 Tax=Tunturiibacter TaxID=3154218 RepID=A0A852VMM0_9BACT|nr:hypothetical protein [Edaphobacter lichenicola]NYF91325.1 hypothetical protein [Edaphobacter lichenicola]
MTVFSRRLPLFVINVMFLVIAAPVLSQSPVAIEATLPDAPLPQAPVEIANNTDEYSSSTLDEARTGQSQTVPAQPTSPGQTDTAQKPMTDEQKKSASEEELQKELHQRIGVVVPNFNAVLDGNNLPLTPGQKMRAAFRSAVDPYQFGLALFTSAIGQAENSHSSYDLIPGTNPAQYMPEGYQQGWGAYGKRFGAAYTDQFDGTILGNGVFPVLLHQDARYFRMGKGTFKKRFFYSVSTTVRCKGDNGNWQPNFSNLLGNLAAGGISNLYYPAADRGFGLTIEQGLLVTAEGVFGALLIEFAPDVIGHFHKNRTPPDVPTQSAP